MNVPAASHFAETEDNLLTLEPEGGVPRERLKDAKSAHAIYLAFRRADKDSAWNRKNVQEMYDGAAPLSGAQLKSLGQGHRNNLNFGEAAAAKEAALSGYNDLTDSVPVMVETKMSPSRGTADERAEKEAIIAEEFHHLLKRWNQFEFNTQMLADQFVAHGVGVAYFPDEVDWRFEVSGLGDFLVPRGTKAHEEAVEVAFATREIAIAKLYDIVEHVERIKDTRWNVDVVKQCIMDASGVTDATLNATQRWERVQDDIKNNDLHVTYAKAKTVSINHIWVREFGGKVSHFIADESGKATDFLFKAVGRFNSMQNCFVLFPFGVGNGSIHSIRGQGYKIFNHVQCSNRLRNSLLDATVLSSSVIVEVEDADDYSNVGLVSFGPVLVKPAGMKIAETQFSNKLDTLMPVIQDLSMQMANNTGSYRTRAVDSGGEARTKFEIQAQLTHEGILTSAAINLFYTPWGRLLGEIFRRVQNVNYREDSPGGEEVWEFRKRCLRRGVTFEDIRAVEDVNPVRAIGSGSPQQRLLAMDELMQIIGTLDEVGRNNLLREKVAGVVGWDQVDRFVPKAKTGMGRPVLDGKIAELENAEFQDGHTINPAPGENHAVHATIHMGFMQQLISQIEQQQLDPAQGAQVFAIAIPHTGYHVEELAMDPTREQIYKEFRKSLSHIHSFAMRLHQQVTDAMQAQMDQAQNDAMQAQQNGGPVTPEMQMQMEKHRLQLQQMAQMGNMKMQLKEQDVKQRMALRDLQTAQRLREKQQEAGLRNPHGNN